MFRLLFSVIKLAAFVIAVLALGNWICWDGRTVSDHIAGSMSSARRADVGGTIKDWAGDAWDTGKQTLSRVGAGFGEGKKSAPPKKNDPRGQDADREEILQSERQKLRDLIRELNGAQKADRD